MKTRKLPSILLIGFGIFSTINLSIGIVSPAQPLHQNVYDYYLVPDPNNPTIEI